MSSPEFTSYLRNSSPISRLQNSNKIPLQELHNSVDLKMSIYRHHPKNYLSSRNQPSFKCKKENSVHAPSTMEQFSEMKASSIIYKIPELSPPEINFQITDQLRQKISEIKQDIVTKLPTIKSSQFSYKKVQSVLSRRTVLKDLQAWLQQKLKTPPLTQEDSIEYKNMIMGVGMKQAIRLIGTRCVEEADIVNQIWELTWSICREIILHLSKRAHKCEKILEEQASFFRVNCQTKIKQSQQQIKQLLAQNLQLKQRSDKLAADLASVKKKNKQLKLTKINLESNYADLKEQFQLIFKQNLILHLKMTPNDQNRRQWAKKKYKLYLNSTKKNDQMFKQFLEKILLENDILFNQEELTQLELRVDINKFKEERSKRMFQIQKQLHESFKTSERQAQTTIAQLRDQAVATEVKTFHEQIVSTDSPCCIETGVNTDTATETKPKNKKQKILKKGNDKKKNDRLSKTKNKLQEPIFKEQDQYSQEEGFQNKDIKNNDSYLEEKVKEEMQATRKNFQENLSQFTEKIKNEQSNKNLGIKEFQKKKSLIFSQQKIQQHILQEGEKHNVSTDYNPSVVTDNDKEIANKNQQANLTQIKINREEELAQEIEKLKMLISQRNNTIINLNKSVKILHKKVDQFEEKRNIDQASILEQEERIKYSDIQAGLNSRKYPQLLDSLERKTYDSQIQGLQEQSLNKIKLASQRQISENFVNNAKHRKDLSYRFEGKQKSLQSKKDLYTDKYDFSSDDMIQQNNKYQIFDDLKDEFEQYPSGKSSKRGSLNNGVKRYRNIKNVRIQQYRYALGTLRFLQICNKYFYDNVQNDFSSNNMITKQALNNEYSKRILKDQYKQIYRQVNESVHAQKTQKQMRIVIQRSLNPLLKQLCKQIQNAQKVSLEKIEEVKISYIPLHILITNKFNLNFGVKKVASKHIKDLLICLKYIKKYTDRYSIISYFLLQSNSLKSSNSLTEAQDSELLFFYMLVITVVDGISSERPVNKDQCFVIGELAKKYLTRDSKLISYIKLAPIELQNENCNNFVNFYRKIIAKYQQISLEKTLQLQFIYLALCKKNKQLKQGNGISWIDFVKFVSVFSIRVSENKDDVLSNWQSMIINTMIQTMLEERLYENGMITNECFLKFVVKCPQFSVQSMRDNIQSLIHLEESQCDLSILSARQKINQICSKDDFLTSISQYLLEKKNISESEISFWVGFMKMYKIQTNADIILQSLLTGVLDPRSQAVILDRNHNLINA